MLCELQFADWVPVPVPRVFAFFANPRNLPRLMPSVSRTAIDGVQLVPPTPPPAPDQETVPINQLAGVGSIIGASFRPLLFLPWRSKWTAAITEFEWNDHFTDVQREGPFKRWHHRHEFLPEHRNGLGGTLVRDVVEYEIGFGPIGTLANSLFVERQLRSTFAHRQEVLPELLL
jgi:ligand-binding SRPBCC domain-containing protein